VRTSGWNRSGGGGGSTRKKRFFLIGGGGHTQLAPFFSERNVLHFLGGAVGGGTGTRKNIPARLHEQQNKRTATNLRVVFQASTHIMDIDFKIFDGERLTTDVEKRPALYNKTTPEYSDKHCNRKLWIELGDAVVLNWSRLDTRARVTTGK